MHFNNQHISNHVQDIRQAIAVDGNQMHLKF